MLRMDSITSRAGTATVNVPSSLMLVPMMVPTTETCPDVTGAVVSESDTRPVMIRLWPRAAGASAARATRNTTAVRLMRTSVERSNRWHFLARVGNLLDRHNRPGLRHCQYDVAGWPRCRGAGGIP